MTARPTSPCSAPRRSAWFVQKSSGGSATYTLGLPGDVPVPNAAIAHAFATMNPVPRDSVLRADFDADGKADLTVFRPSTGTWYTRFSSTGFATSGALSWGLDGDVPAPGDYDGDGVAEIAVFRPSDGHWYFASPNQYPGPTLIFGLSGDVTVQADYNGDRIADVAVYRPSTSEWFAAAHPARRRTRGDVRGERRHAGPGGLRRRRHHRHGGLHTRDRHVDHPSTPAPGPWCRASGA